ncbi:sensor histidine kinase, partial [Streptomyces sp. SID2955]|nr:sensor histidine kinase [Streptomyces sp. SID2955]
MNTDMTRNDFRTVAREALLAAVQGLVLAIVVLPCGLAFVVLTLVSLAFVPLGIGLLTTPAVLTGVRALADTRRKLAAQWCGIHVPAVYQPLPRGGSPWTRTFVLLRDPQVRRDLLWLPVDMTAGFVTALLPALVVFYPLQGIMLAAGLWRAYVPATGESTWYLFVPVSGQGTAFLAAVLGVAILAVGWRRTPRLLAAHFRLTRTVLGGDAELAERVRVLTETRRDAVDTSAAELRRIERDLHDGAQARLVAMGMDLGTVEMLVERDPAQAKKLIAQARRNSAEALEELRDLVRGIHPPVLAERGLGDAVRALALRLPLPAEVTVELPGRADAPVESA